MMSNKLNFALSVVFLLLIGALSCQKVEDTSVENSANHAFNLTAKTYGYGILINWTASNFENFNQYQIVRSKNPLPASYEPTIVPGIVVENQETNSYLDKEEILLSEALYYTLFVKRTDGYEKSEQVFVTTNFRKVDFDNTEIRMIFNPKNDLLYALNRSGSDELLKVFNAQSGELIAEDTLENNYNPAFTFGQMEGEDVLFVTSIFEEGYEIRDARTLTVKAHQEKNDLLFGNLTFDKGFLCYKESSWRVFRADDGSNYFNFPGQEGGIHLFTIGQEDLQFVSIGENRLEYLKLDTMGNIRGFASKPTLSNPTVGYAVSPNGQYFFGDEDGNYFDKTMLSLGQLDIGNEEDKFVDFAFSEDGNYIFAIADNGTNQLKKYAFPSLSLEREYTLSYSIKRIFIKGNKLITFGRYNGGFNNYLFQLINLEEIDD